MVTNLQFTRYRGSVERNDFSAKKSSNYLVVPNNLLLSLSLSLSHWRHANNYTLKFFLLRAREAWRISHKQRAFQSSLCSITRAFLRTNKRQNKTKKHRYNHANYEEKTIKKLLPSKIYIDTCRNSIADGNFISWAAQSGTTRWHNFQC